MKRRASEMRVERSIGEDEGAARVFLLLSAASPLPRVNQGLVRSFFGLPCIIYYLGFAVTNY